MASPTKIKKAKTARQDAKRMKTRYKKAKAKVRKAQRKGDLIVS